MNKHKLRLFVFIYLLGLCSEVYTQDMLILPMPGQKLPQSPANQQKKQTGISSKEKSESTVPAYKSQKGQVSPKGAILPMPDKNAGKTGRDTKQNPTRVQPPLSSNLSPTPRTDSNSQSLVGNEPLIAIPAKIKPSSRKYDDDFIPPPPPPLVKKGSEKETAQNPMANISQEEDLSSFFNDTDFPKPDEDFSNDTEDKKIEDLLPPTQQETTVANETTGETITVYPKDTGSAIFMVMKSWKCDDYDCSKLLEQALEVYGKEADDSFKINGLNNLTKGVAVSVEEEDITFDELLDVLAVKTGNDWGADVPNKTIHIYPKGIKADSYVSWE